MVGESKINGPSNPSFPNRPIYRLNLDLYKSSLKMISALDKILVKVLLLIKEWCYNFFYTNLINWCVNFDIEKII